MSERIAICPGSYDPVTNGHLDIIGRAARVFDRVIVGVVGQGIRKSKTMFSAEERRDFLLEATAEIDNVEIEVFTNLLVEFARERGATVIVKGIRAISDFEYELEMNQLNRKLAPELESVYVFASPDYSFLSSTGVKEMATFGADVSDLVPAPGGRGAARAGQALSGCPGQELATSRRKPRSCSRSARWPRKLPELLMDVLVLIDKLDDLIHNARPVPLTDQVRVDREEIYDLLDQMRATIPEEIKQARWIVKERQEMLAEAKREAERVVKEARDQQERLISDEEVYKQAERAAEEIIEDARETERQIRLGAEDYADEILSTLEVNLEKFLSAVQRGRDRLAGRDEEPVEVQSRHASDGCSLASAPSGRSGTLSPEVRRWRAVVLRRGAARDGAADDGAGGRGDRARGPRRRRRRSARR